MRAKIYGTLLCDDCGAPLKPLNPEGTVLTCSNSNCKRSKKEYEAPSINLVEVKKPPSRGGK